MTTSKTGKILLLLLSIVVSSTMFSCTKKNDTVPDKKNDTVQDIVYNLAGNANGGQEAPNRVTTTATGTITGTYNKTTNILQYTINWTGLSAPPSAMHFHAPADPGVAAPVKIPITGFTASATGSVSKSDTLKTEADEADFLLGKWYYNLHTPANPGGEIRGQIFPTR